MFAGDIFRHDIRNSLECDFDVSDATSAFSDRRGHRFDVAVHGVIEDEEFRHRISR
jgi:hypothetical protein